MDYANVPVGASPPQTFVDDFKRAVKTYQEFIQVNPGIKPQQLAYQAVEKVGFLEKDRSHFMLAFKVMNYQQASTEERKLYILVEAWTIYSQP